jgi:hypothetical protein
MIEGKTASGSKRALNPVKNSTILRNPRPSAVHFICCRYFAPWLGCTVCHGDQCAVRLMVERVVVSKSQKSRPNCSGRPDCDLIQD